MSKNATLTGPLPDYFGRAAQMPYEEVHLPEPSESPTRYLSPIERATVKVQLVGPLPSGRSILAEAALRMALFESRGVLEHMSGHYLAQTLHYTFFSVHPVAVRQARKGWVLLAALDAANLGVEVWTSAEPLSPFGAFRRIRLHERLSELDRSTPRARRQAQ